MLLSNKNIKGEPIFCENERIKQRSLKIYTYLVCISHLKDSYSGTRIFQQREINNDIYGVIRHYPLAENDGLGAYVKVMADEFRTE